MRSGEIRERVKLQSRADTADSYGAPTLAPTTITTVWAKVEATSPGSESKQGGQIVGSTTYDVTIRYSDTVSAVTTKHQAVWRGKTLNIAAVVTLPNREGIVLSCAEVSA